MCRYDYDNIDKQIPINELQLGHWYEGKGRNGNVGCWNGYSFLVIAMTGMPVGRKETSNTSKWVSIPCVKQEPYFTKTEGCFQPFSVVDNKRKLAELLSSELNKLLRLE
jgi:hypothetical protein